MLELAASEAADVTAFSPSGKLRPIMCLAAPPPTRWPLTPTLTPTLTLTLTPTLTLTLTLTLTIDPDH